MIRIAAERQREREREREGETNLAKQKNGFDK